MSEVASAAPLRDIRFVLYEMIGVDDTELIDAILDGAARFASEVLASLNQGGDIEGARWTDGVVAAPQGFRDAYEKFVAGGWNALACDPADVGQGLPAVVAAAVDKMWHASNMAFALCPPLTHGAIEALSLRGTEAPKALFVPNMVEGTSTGTMNLTEPAAGSDLSAVRTRAVPEGDHHRIFGQKILLPTASTTWPRTSFISCWCGRPTRPRG